MRFPAPLARVAVLLTVVLLATSCAIGVRGGRTDPGSTASQGDPQDFRNDLDGAIKVAEQYWTGKFQSAGLQFRPIGKIIPYTRDGEVDCGGQPLTRNNAAYCSAGDFIAYDVNWAAQQYVDIGDAFLYFLLGHEYAHGIQVRFGLEYRFTIEQELQADCLAGAYIGDSVRAGALTLQDGDIQELQKGLLAVADDPGQPWFAEGSHGNAAQRTTAFFSGYQQSIAPCGLARR
jgi:predicted metalloprotease